MLFFYQVIHLKHFNPRSPRGERQEYHSMFAAMLEISIHAPREGSDYPVQVEQNLFPRFQSTLPARGATIFAPQFGQYFENFNPRSPRGERRYPH